MNAGDETVKFCFRERFGCWCGPCRVVGARHARDQTRHGSWFALTANHSRAWPAPTILRTWFLTVAPQGRPYVQAAFRDLHSDHRWACGCILRPVGATVTRSIGAAQLTSGNGVSRIAFVSDLPESMRDPGDHRLWPKGGPVTLLVEGFVRNSAGGLRVTAQLVDTHSNDHAWSTTYEAGREITSDVVAAVENQVVLIARNQTD